MEVGTGALGSLPDKLDELLKEEYMLQTSVKREVESLSRELRSMHAALPKVPRDQLSKEFRIWELSYKMEKDLDNILVRMESKEFTKKMADLFRKGKTRYQIADAIKDIKYRVQQVTDKRERHRVEDIAANPAALTIEPRLRDLREIIGMEEARDELESMEVGTGPLGSLPDKLDELLKEEYKLQTSVKREVESLSRELRSMHAALPKVPRDQLSKGFRLWELSYKMEKDLDNILVRMESKEFTKKMADLFRKGKTRYQIADAIKDIKYRVQQVTDKREWHRVEDVTANPAALTIEPRLRDLRDIIGMEEARDELINLLSQGDQQLKILSIVGFGGLGKTTLAKAVYDKLKMQFDYRAFVPMSRNPDVRKVLTNILDDLIGKQKYMKIPKDEGQLIDQIKEFLLNKRYLIVIDDLWKAGHWDRILCSLPKNDCGSIIIATTRANDIAKMCCSDHDELIYEIKHLGYLNSKKLFLKRCFGSEFSCHVTLTEVDEILKICGGVPLAIITIASAIASLLIRKVKEPWQEMMKSLHSARGDFGSVEELTKILLCSYFDLPSTQRTCLLYLAASAKNQRIQKDNLVRKWIVEGLIPEDEECSREEVAGRYFDELINKNVIWPVEYGNCTYGIHYMMLYALGLIAREENFATILSDFDTPQAYVDVTPVRLFIQCSGSEHSIGTGLMNLTNVLSITMLGPAKLVSFKCLEYVQVLDLDGCQDLENSAMDDICRMVLLRYLSLKQTQVTTLPPQIGELQNLEFLDVGRTQISNLPPEIGKLQNLETLDVRQTRMKELPNELVQLPKLAHLHFGQSGSLGGVKLPVGSDQLKSVKVMGTVDSRKCSKSDMKEISELTEVRELEVVLYDGSADREQNDKLLSCVGMCRNLQSLTIYGDSNPSNELPTATPNFPLLKKLKVAGRFVKVPPWIANLSALSLLDIKICKLEPDDLEILGKVPCLSSLSLALVASLPRRRVVITHSAGFASLEEFNFDCRVPWVTFEKGAMPSLKHLGLKLYACPADKSPSGIVLLRSLKKVILWYCSQYAGSDGVTETVAVMREAAASHANLIVLSINGDKEIFPSSTSVDRRITGAEIEEC